MVLKLGTETASKSSAAAEKRAKEQGDALAALDPLHQLYRKTIGSADRCALELVILNCIRKGRV